MDRQDELSAYLPECRSDVTSKDTESLPHRKCTGRFSFPVVVLTRTTIKLPNSFL